MRARLAISLRPNELVILEPAPEPPWLQCRSVSSVADRTAPRISVGALVFNGSK